MLAATILDETEEEPLLGITHTTPGGARKVVSLRSALLSRSYGTHRRNHLANLTTRPVSGAGLAV